MRRRRKLDDHDSALRLMCCNWNLHGDRDRNFAKPGIIVQHKVATGGYTIGGIEINSLKIADRLTALRQ